MATIEVTPKLRQLVADFQRTDTAVRAALDRWTKTPTDEAHVAQWEAAHQEHKTARLEADVALYQLCLEVSAAVATHDAAGLHPARA